MTKYCHDDTIHNCLIECEKCSAYYDDEQLDNYLVTEKDCEDFIEEKIRADERKKTLDEVERVIYSMDFDFGDFYDHTKRIQEMLTKRIELMKGGQTCLGE